MEYVYIYSNHGKVTQLSVSPAVCSFFNRCEEYAKKETEMEQMVSFIPQCKHMFVMLVSNMDTNETGKELRKGTGRSQK